jgi:hypothetical protein
MVSNPSLTITGWSLGWVWTSEADSISAQTEDPHLLEAADETLLTSWV